MKLLILFITSLLINTLSAKRVVLLENNSVDSDHDYIIVYHNVSLVKGSTYLNAEVHVVKDIPRYFSISTMSAIKKDGAVVQFFNRTVDACSLFKHRRRNDWFFRLFLVAYTKFSDLPLECPMRKGVYHLTNFNLDGSIFPEFIYIPDSKTKFVSDFFTPQNGKNYKFMTTISYVRIVNL